MTGIQHCPPPGGASVHIQFQEWPGGDAVPLTVGDVQVWMGRVPVDEDELIQLARQLSLEERDRAGRIAVDLPRREFILGRAMARKLVGEALQVDPGDVKFDRRIHGKPCLYPATVDHPLRFNVSHSGGRVVVALAVGREVGVDLEWIHGLEEWNDISARIFSRRERAELHALPVSLQRQAFFNGWTRKEAWLKATGEGLTEALPAIEVTLAPGRPPEWLALPGGWDVMRQWSIQDIPLPEGFAGAVVYEHLISRTIIGGDPGQRWSKVQKK